MMASGCRGGRRARSSGGVMARRSEAAARWQQAQRTGSSVAARAGVRARVARRAQRSQGERGRERKRVEREKERGQRVDL